MSDTKVLTLEQYCATFATHNYNSYKNVEYYCGVCVKQVRGSDSYIVARTSNIIPCILCLTCSEECCSMWLLRYME
jgi:hypothetical protein